MRLRIHASIKAVERILYVGIILPRRLNPPIFSSCDMDPPSSNFYWVVVGGRAAEEVTIGATEERVKW